MRASKTSRRPTVRSATVKRTLYRAVREVRHPQRAVERRKIRSEVAEFLGGRAVLRGYARELRTSGLMEHLFEQARDGYAEIGGSGHSLARVAFGHLDGAPVARRERSSRRI